MKLSYFFIANALLAVVGGLGLLVMPEQLMSSQGTSLNAGGVYIARIMGMLLLGMALVSWQVRNLKDGDLLKPLLSAFALVHLGIVVLNIWALNSNLVNSTGWGDIVLHGALGSGFLYYLLNPKKV